MEYRYWYVLRTLCVVHFFFFFFSLIISTLLARRLNYCDFNPANFNSFCKIALLKLKIYPLPYPRRKEQSTIINSTLEISKYSFSLDFF